MITQLVGQGSFGAFWLSLGMITPAGQLTSDEFKQQISRRSRQLNLWFEFARLDHDCGIGQHHVAPLKALPPHVGQGFVRIAQGHGAEPVPQAIRLEQVNAGAVVNAGDTGDGQAAAALLPQ